MSWRNPRRGLFAGSPSVKAEPEPETDLPGEPGDGRRATDTSERGLEDIIFSVHERSAGWIPGSSGDYDREYCVDLAQLSAFLRDTQPDAAEALALDGDSITRQRFLARLKRQGDRQPRRGGSSPQRRQVHGQHSVSLFYATPSAGNERAAGTSRPEPFLRNPPASLQCQKHSPSARPSAVHQRTAGGDLRAEEQPHQADRGGRRGAVQARPRSTRGPVQAGPLHGPLRG